MFENGSHVSCVTLFTISLPPDLEVTIWGARWALYRQKFVSKEYVTSLAPAHVDLMVVFIMKDVVAAHMRALEFGLSLFDFITGDVLVFFLTTDVHRLSLRSTDGHVSVLG